MSDSNKNVNEDEAKSTFDKAVNELNVKYRLKRMLEIKEKIQSSLIFLAYFISLILSRSNPVFSAVLATFILFLILVFVLIEDGKIDLNGIHKKEGFGCGVYFFLAFFIPVYFGIYLGYEDKKFESFLIKNQCSYIENESTEAEYYCSKPDKKITRSTYDYIQSNMGFNSDSGVVFNSGWSK